MQCLKLKGMVQSLIFKIQSSKNVKLIIKKGQQFLIPVI